jgi:hypothetical protein
MGKPIVRSSSALLMQGDFSVKWDYGETNCPLPFCLSYSRRVSCDILIPSNEPTPAGQVSHLLLFHCLRVMLWLHWPGHKQDPIAAICSQGAPLLPQLQHDHSLPYCGISDVILYDGVYMVMEFLRWDLLMTSQSSACLGVHIILDSLRKCVLLHGS